MDNIPTQRVSVASVGTTKQERPTLQGSSAKEFSLLSVDTNLSPSPFAAP